MHLVVMSWKVPFSMEIVVDGLLSNVLPPFFYCCMFSFYSAIFLFLLFSLLYTSTSSEVCKSLIFGLDVSPGVRLLLLG